MASRCLSPELLASERAAKPTIEMMVVENFMLFG